MYNLQIILTTVPEILLQFDIACRNDELVKHNLKTLYGVMQVPCDTYMRERLDEVEPHFLKKSIDAMIAQEQRGKVLEQYRYFDEYCLVAIDASGYFSSNEIHCDSCCKKNHRDGAVTYYHQMLAAIMVYPGYPTVFPLAIEPIIKEDGTSKNDCEHNAAKRLLKSLRNSHPHLKMLVTLDTLYADGSIIKLLKELDFRFIITARNDDLKYLFNAYGACKKEEVFINGAKRRYLFSVGLPLNDTHQDCTVNILEQF